ncbi:DlpA domain protein [Xylona heveae TC161]|uniref:DlpA domain protein n=1 Tax=Xylona heveae (strain CBS 132557 / TC161) TaxID=1328760 RepID=A0A164ZKF6_XYLHT|nr:DlpA domain protein [Xylona heveae TC161]KZF19203.1 DlpA domain protein [Xylona heveae TC161]
MLFEELTILQSYSACDVSDALLKLNVPGAGLIPDMLPFAPHAPYSADLDSQAKVVGPASTVAFVPKDPDQSSTQAFDPNTPMWIPNIPPGTHYVDLTSPETVVVMSQPPDQRCAVLGGIMAARMKVRGAKGVVVGGRVRDLRELRSVDLPIWAQSTSTVGTALEAKPYAIDVPISVNGRNIQPGDIMFCDPLEGVVVIPQKELENVLQLLPRLTEADDRVKEDIYQGGSVTAAFAKHRSSL